LIGDLCFGDPQLKPVASRRIPMGLLCPALGRQELVRSKGSCVPVASPEFGMGDARPFPVSLVGLVSRQLSVSFLPSFLFALSSSAIKRSNEQTINERSF
jgi:hypothetical protein